MLPPLHVHIAVPANYVGMRAISQYSTRMPVPGNAAAQQPFRSRRASILSAVEDPESAFNIWNECSRSD